jgi:predicted metal-dependent hydrolase
LEQEEGLIHGDVELKKYITTYYKKLFRPSDHNNLVIDESYRDDIPQVTAEENVLLLTEFMEEEIRGAIF